MDVVCTFDGSEGADHKAQLAVFESALSGRYDGIALNHGIENYSYAR